jgi:hypothetical protein
MLAVMLRPPGIRTVVLAVFAAMLCVPSPALAASSSDALRIDHSLGRAAITEGDAGYGFDVSLRSAPSADVTVSIAAPGLVASPATLTFTAADWSVAQEVVVAAPDDDAPGQALDRTVSVASSSGDLSFNSLVRTFDVAVHDDDAIAVVLDHVGDGTTVTEGDTTDTVVVRLGTRPRGPVTVFLDGVGLVAAPDMVVVRPDQWATGLPVTVAAHADELVQGSRGTELVAHSLAPVAEWNDLASSIPVAIEDAAVLRSASPDTTTPPAIPTSQANRTPSVPAFAVPTVWQQAGSVSLRFRSADPDGDPVRYRVLHRSHPWGARRAKPWALLGEVTDTRFDAGRIGPLEQRCFRIEAVDPMGAAASTTVSCTHGLADDRALAARYGWKPARVRGAWNGSVSTSTPRGRLVYFTHTGTHAQLTFLRCRTCASIELVDVEDRHHTISLRGTGRRVVTVPLRRTGRRIWGFYVRGSGSVRFDSLAVVRPAS